MLWVVAALLILGFLFLIVWALADLLILVQAFSADWVQGLLCVLVPFYIVYWMLFRLEHDHKKLLLLGYFGGFGGVVACFGLLTAIFMVAGPEIASQMME